MYQNYINLVYIYGHYHKMFFILDFRSIIYLFYLIIIVSLKCNIITIEIIFTILANLSENYFDISYYNKILMGNFCCFSLTRLCIFLLKLKL